uniref:CSON014300 protein n=1 Tax=Culicoides sonorensis TaxID=179676 RepID=A0A336MEK0_CULSO
MKACKLCEIYDHQQQQQQQQPQQQKSGDKSTENKNHKNITNNPGGFICNHNNPLSRPIIEAQLSQFNQLLTPNHLRDVFLAAQILRGYYQPAGPLISSHLLQPQPPKTIPPNIDSDGRAQQQPQSSGSAAGDSDNDVLITGADRPPQPYRYGPQGPGLYSRPVHQMHCPTYASNYYPPYPQHPQDMCYPYQGPYYPPKPYAPAPFPGRYAYPYGPPGPSDMYERPPPQNPPPASGQIVAAGPSVPQHMEHYPGPQPYYPNYNQPGGQCYSRGIQPPYMDPSHYQNTCPCPMQSCPKNVHTGPLIGSKASKGPVKTEPLIATTNTTSSTSCASSNTIATQSTTTPIITCKTEELSPLPKHIIIKPEHCSQQGSNSSTNTNNNNVQCPEKIVHAPLPINPNYVMNPELGLPEISVSPARGSIGLPQAVPMTRAEIAQGNNEPVAPIQRRPRIGKSMERERLNFPNGCPLTDAGGTITRLEKTTELISNIKTEIEQETPVKVKQEEIEEILSSEEEKMEIESVSSTMTNPITSSEKYCNTNTPRKLTPFTIEALVNSDSCQGTKASSVCSMSTNDSKRKDHDEDSDNSVIRIEDNSSPEIPVKRRKLLNDANVIGPKKSPPNSYKCLIKQATFKNYLGEAKHDEEPTSTTTVNNSNSTNISTTSSNDDQRVVETVKKKLSLKRSRRRKIMKSRKIVLKIKQRMIAIPKQLRRKRKYSLKKLKKLTPKQECVEIVDMTTEDDHEQQIKIEPVPIDVSSPSVEEVPIHEEDKSDKLETIPATEDIDNSIVSIKEEPCDKPTKEISNEIEAPKEEESNNQSVNMTEHETETCSTVLAETGTSTPTSQMTNIDLTIDMVARGYFSEPEILNSVSKNRIKKLKLQEGRSKSETNREKQDKLDKILKAKAKELKAKKREAKKMEKELKRAKKAEKKMIEETENKATREEVFEPTNTIIEEAIQEEPSTEVPELNDSDKMIDEVTKPKKGRKSKTHAKKIKTKKEKKSDTKTNKKQMKAIASDVITSDQKDGDFEMEVTPPEIITINNNIITSIIEDDELPLEELVKLKKRKATKQFSTAPTRKPKQTKNKTPSTKQTLKNTTETIVPVTSPLDNTDASNAKDDLITPTQVTPIQEEMNLDDSSLVETDTVNNNKLIFYNNDYTCKVNKPTHKRGKCRTKFGNKKRHRQTYASKEIEEVLIPRSVNSKPRWCNGWSWHGKPFQAKVFLNSDDPPVLRTCYPAMVHQTGDIIRPKDCVLLRAGNKRTELPYVAKIAYLWENPEDGEMMTSLLWYYRPEHTEQGRQPADSPEEVFASRHKDHNSVACIEDKCYVLTYNEYCRYRRQLRAIEDGVYETNSIVPKLNRENTRNPPPNTLPDLTVFL